MKSNFKKEEIKRKNSTSSLKQFSSSFKSKQDSLKIVSNLINTNNNHDKTKLNSSNNLPIIYKNNIDEADSNIKVFVRVRPFNNSEKEMGSEECVKINENSINIKINNLNKSEKNNEYDFNFDKVFDGLSTQEEVFKTVALPVITGVINGYNGTILAYGQTSSGKSFTMQGDIKSSSMKGLIPRIAEDIYIKLSNLGNIEFKTTVSVFEIYQEKIRDLLSTNNKNLSIRENQTQGVYVEGLEEINVIESTEILQILDKSISNRTVNSTNMNEYSSRSHLIFLMNLSIINNDDLSKKSSKLYLVDLAGSEKISKTGATGVLLDEAKGINKSLTTLGMVIKCLTETSSGKQTHIPYRDSKLTRILSESLGGNSKTSLIITLSPSSFNDNESLSSLRFGLRAKSIKNKAKINKETNISELRLEIDKLNVYSLKIQAKLDKTINFLKLKGYNTDCILDDELDYTNVNKSFLNRTDTIVNESVFKANGADLIQKVNSTIIEEDSILEKTLIYNKQEKPLLAINRESSNILNQSKMVNNIKEVSAIDDIKIKYVELLYIVNELEDEKNEIHEKYKNLLTKKDNKTYSIFEGDFFSIISQKCENNLVKNKIKDSNYPDNLNQNVNIITNLNNITNSSKMSCNSENNSKMTHLFSKHLLKKSNNTKNNISNNDNDTNKSIQSNEIKDVSNKDLKSANYSDNELNTQITFKILDKETKNNNQILNNGDKIKEFFESIFSTFEEILFDLDLINTNIGVNNDIPYMLTIYNDKLKGLRKEFDGVINGSSILDNTFVNLEKNPIKKKFRFNYDSNKSILTDDVILNMEKKANKLIHNHIKSIPGIEKVIYQPLFVKRNLNNFKYKFS